MSTLYLPNVHAGMHLQNCPKMNIVQNQKHPNYAKSKLYKNQNAHRLSGETQQGILVRMGGSLCIVYDSTENVWRVSPQVMNSNSDPRDRLEKKIKKNFFQCL